jgi:hypothetical protein
MRFVMMLADRLKKSIEEIMMMSMLEIQMWAGYILNENQEHKKTMNAQKNRSNPRRGR